MDRTISVVLAGALVCAGTTAVDAQTLRGSPQAMQKQNRIALQHDYTFLRTAAQVRSFVASGYLVHMPGNGDYELASVSYPYARPAVKLFVERLASQYRAACGEKLVVTSLTRPVQEQPRNASPLSVHPAGMAIDLRISGRSACRNWLERTLMALERQGVLDAIRENRPPHYHVALFPNQYTRYVAGITAGQSTARLASAEPKHADVSPPTIRTASVAAGFEMTEDAVADYRVSRGDSLWSIARRHGTTVEALKSLNGLRNSHIVAGQTIAVPVTVATGADSS
ncbi:hypothetical protein BH23GEM9_BH23GEM9_21820 [soil metagenome]